MDAPDTKGPNVSSRTQGQPWTRNGITVSLASSVSELMESVQWWVSNQEGISSDDKVLKGVRMAGRRTGELLESSVLIYQLSHQKEGMKSRFNTRIEIAQKALESRQPVGIMIEHNHPSLLQRDIKLPEGEKFALLGIFILTDVWIGYSEDSKLLMVRFDKVSLDGIWWDKAVKDNTATSETKVDGDKIKASIPQISRD
ncbi:hypothetical protein F5B20DRAFT_593196 [Whalleya microplaca]|nr:hypothetical protein F5B20DRAFT_593196 [Whalleya microplaca]